MWLDLQNKSPPTWYGRWAGEKPGRDLAFNYTRLEEPMYVCHKDHVNQLWLVFKRVNGQEEYIRSFVTYAEAKTYCDIFNGVR